MQGSLFTVHHYSGFKRWKLRLFHQSILENKQNNIFACSHAHGAWSDTHGCMRRPCLMCRDAWGSSSSANFADFVRFRAFFRLEMPWNMEWFFLNLYCLQIPSKNHWSSFFISLILHMMSCFADLYDFSLKKHKTHILCRIKFYLLLLCTRENNKWFNISFDKILAHKNEIFYLFSCLQSFSFYRKIYIFRWRETPILKSFCIAYYKLLYVYNVNE